MSLANYLTLTRIIILPLFLFIFFSNHIHNELTAGLVLILSSLTDFLDGYVARKYEQTTKLGRLLDPLADKITLIAIFIAFAVKDLLSLKIIIVIVIREFIILIGSIVMYFNHEDVINPSKIGKLATFLLYLSALIYIFNIKGLKMIIFLALGLTIISGVHYFIKAFLYLARNEEF